MQVVEGQIVRIGREAVETMQDVGYVVPADGLAWVKTNPDSDGRVLISWKEERGRTLWVNQEWLHPYEAPVETVTLKLDDETMLGLLSAVASLEEGKGDRSWPEMIREAVKELGVK